MATKEKMHLWELNRILRGTMVVTTERIEGRELHTVGLVAGKTISELKVAADGQKADAVVGLRSGKGYWYGTAVKFIT